MFDLPEAEPDQLFVDPFAVYGVSPMQAGVGWLGPGFEGGVRRLAHAGGGGGELGPGFGGGVWRLAHAGGGGDSRLIRGWESGVRRLAHAGGCEVSWEMGQCSAKRMVAVGMSPGTFLSGH